MAHATDIQIVIPDDGDDADIPAYLLATIGAPPSARSRSVWQQTLTAFRWEIARARFPSEGTSPTETVRIPRDALLLSEHTREKRLKSGFVNANDALLAAHGAMASVVNIAAELTGQNLQCLPKSYRNLGTRDAQITRALSYEAWTQAYRESVGAEPLPQRGPAFTGSTAMIKNFNTRIMAPIRPVLHLAIGLAQAIDMTEQMLIAETGNSQDWIDKGFGTYAAPIGDDDVALRPQVHIQSLYRHPLVSKLAIQLAEELEAPVMRFLSEGRAGPTELVRLRL